MKMLSGFRRVVINFVRTKATWVQPEGHDTGIKIYNCVVKDKVPLIAPRERPFISWYTCGPTVYESAHIGHASCYVKFDIIQRILRDYFKIKLVHVMNITDVDDKIINESKLHNKSPIEIARYYEKEYLDDLRLLEVKNPDVLARVTDNIPIIIKFIKKLVDENFAYVASDGSVYFDVSKYENYGKLQNIGTSSEASDSFKKNPADFALWKAAKPEEPFWDGTFGPGRPGWHIECSALAGNIIGSTIDIHAGGIDLRFPHHENEEAQSCAFFNTKQWVNYWMHSGHLHLKDDTKMSKSLKNTINIKQMLNNYDSRVFRMSCLMTHYRNNMEYSNELMEMAKRNLTSVKNFIDNCNVFLRGQLIKSLDNDVLRDALNVGIDEIDAALRDDFNTPQVLRALNKMMGTINRMLMPNENQKYESDRPNMSHFVYIVTASNYVQELFKVFGINLQESVSSVSNTDYNDVMDVLLKFRQNVRQLGILQNNDAALRLCDEVRDELKKTGVNIKDHGKVSSWSR